MWLGRAPFCGVVGQRSAEMAAATYPRNELIWARRVGGDGEVAQNLRRLLAFCRGGERGEGVRERGREEREVDQQMSREVPVRTKAPLGRLRLRCRAALLAQPRIPCARLCGSGLRLMAASAPQRQREKERTKRRSLKTCLQWGRLWPQISITVANKHHSYCKNRVNHVAGRADGS